MNVGQTKIEIVAESCVKMYQESAKNVKKTVHCFPLMILQKDRK